jgi:hypothetical protein
MEFKTDANEEAGIAIGNGAPSTIIPLQGMLWSFPQPQELRLT